MDFLQARLGNKASVAAGEAMLVRDRQQDGQGDGQSENRVSPLQGINVLQRMMRDVECRYDIHDGRLGRRGTQDCFFELKYSHFRKYGQ